MEKLEQMTNAITCFLSEYCEVNGITEQDLGRLVLIHPIKEENCIQIVDFDTQKRVIFEVRAQKNRIHTSGEYKEDTFVKTTTLINNINKKL